jgi:hypothetical protein
VIVGHSELENVEPQLGRAWGKLRPALGYELVQPVFRIYAKAVPSDRSTKDNASLERYYKSRDALNLELVDAGGHPIHTTVIHIADYTVEQGSNALELDVLISDDAYWTTRGA